MVFRDFSGTASGRSFKGKAGTFKASATPFAHFRLGLNADI
jgi:hypothetical protein